MYADSIVLMFKEGPSRKCAQECAFLWNLCVYVVKTKVAVFRKGIKG